MTASVLTETKSGYKIFVVVIIFDTVSKDGCCLNGGQLRQVFHHEFD